MSLEEGNELIYIHFEFEGWKPHLLSNSKENKLKFSLWKMIQPGEHYFFYTLHGASYTSKLYEKKIINQRIRVRFATLFNSVEYRYWKKKKERF